MTCIDMWAWRGTEGLGGAQRGTEGHGGAWGEVPTATARDR